MSTSVPTKFQTLEHGILLGDKLFEIQIAAQFSWAGADCTFDAARIVLWEIDIDCTDERAAEAAKIIDFSSATNPIGPVLVEIPGVPSFTIKIDWDFNPALESDELCCLVTTDGAFDDHEQSAYFSPPTEAQQNAA